MQVDWVTVTAQLVNFLILVYLLKRFLYAPVLAAVDRRQARITGHLDEAARREGLAAKAEETFQQRLEEMERTRSQALARLEQEVAAERNERMTALRDEIAAARDHWREAIEREQERFVRALSAASTELTVDLARRLLSDLADETLEARVVQRFRVRLETLDAEQRELIRAASGAVEIHTGFDLEDAARESIRSTLRTTLSIGRDVEFKRSPTLVCGIELVSGHARVGWNVASHLEQLERGAGDALVRAVAAFTGDDPGREHAR